MATETHEVTGTRDVTFDLVSVLYHALEAAGTATQYEEDAKGEGKPEIAAFFREVIAVNRTLAEGAKEILRSRLQETATASHRMSEKLLDKTAADSFPASDPPAVY